jgi:hypothetical protein
MKAKFSVMASCAGLLLSNFAAAQTQSFTPFDGGAPDAGEIPGTLNGKAVTVLRITADYHQMNLPPHTAQPIGLRNFFYVLKGSPTGHSARCEAYIKKVQKDEAAWTKASPTFPYLEINFAQGAKQVTVNGIGVYREIDIQCWEAFDMGPPVF